MLLFLLLGVHFAVVRTQTLPGSCDFESGTCGYVSDPSLSQWAVNQDGSFISVDWPLVERSEKAVLVSPELEMFDWSCVRLVYQITGSGSLRLHLRSEGDTFDRTLWTADAPSESWLLASIDLWNTSASTKMVLEGRPGSSPNNSVSIFEIHIVPGYCIECNFEESHMCGYRNQWNPSVNWFMGGPDRETKSNLTTKTGHYMYVNSRYASNRQEVARLVSPMTTTPMSGCLSFHYLQSQDGGSEFSVFTRDTLGQGEEIWRPRVYHTSTWTLVQLDIKAPYPLEVVFEAAFSKPSSGRVVLDNISFSAEFCNAETEPTFDPSIANCDFEMGFCGYRQGQKDGSVWKRVAVKPNLYRTGDHSTGAGSFLLANTQISRRPGYMSRLFGLQLPGRLKYCLRFYYALMGFRRTDGALAVYIQHEKSNTQEKIWAVSRSSKDIWTEVEITFQRPKATKVVFVSVCKNFWDCGSVALDDISVTLGDCSLSSGVFLSIPGQCDFESGNCGYTQEKDTDTVDWVLARGSTPTSYTGPSGDHTTGMGHYMYIEASPMLPGQSARLVSGDIRGSGSPLCLQFHFHMFGSGTGRLSIYLRQEGQGQEEVLWSRLGEQSISWLKAEVDYKCDRKHQIVFEAVRGTSIRSDIAIDDILFKKGPCKATGRTVPQSGFSKNFNDIEH
ncbi:hypothetical protein AAFF_G00372600 [Aldrovandia affinis]|uniref:MAM domain-containing protein n=1 Tax=Aldrovandia affinis TaxID=143900 RepID=A0AAD7SGG8_9TELE|nr:hypothetical protein AAFF_G00372600 [Aldrovandia affinis]